MHRSQFYPFPPRPGVGLETVNLAAERTPLAESELQAVLDFEHSLYEVTLDAEAFPSAAAYKQEQAKLDTPVESFETVWSKKVNSTELGVGYFMTDEGAAALEDASGACLQRGTPEETRAALAGLSTSAIDAKTLDKLEAVSIGYEEARLAQLFKDNDFSGQDVPAPQLVRLYKNPDVLVAKARGYRQLKTYLTKVKADLHGQTPADGSPILETQAVLVDKYRQRINQFLAGIYVEAYKLLGQYRASGETNHGSAIKTLEAVIPVFSSQAESDAIAGFLQRMDRFRYGVSKNAEGDFTWLSAPAHDLTVQANDPKTGSPVDRGIYEDLDPDGLASTMVDGVTFGQLLSGVMETYDLLSADTAWNSERTGSASDGRWQVIVDSKFKSLRVNDKQRIVQVPEKSVSLLKVMAVGEHELVHVLQHENKRKLGGLAILQKIGLDNPLEQVEAGGMWRQGVVQEALTGVTDTSVAGIGYYKNVEIKAQGGSFGDCVQAYYDYLRSSNPAIDPDTATLQAVNRARRVFRHGGFEFAQDTPYLTNTQPLHYLEQQLIYKGLDERARKFLLVGGITIANLVELHSIGLVDAENITIPDAMPAQLMYPVVKGLLAKKAAA